MGILILREVCRKAAIDLLYMGETKLDDSFPDVQFHTESCHRDKTGGGKMIFKRLYAYEDSTSKTICLEVTISKKKWCVTFAYRPPYNCNKHGFFKELNKSLSNITRKYENALVVGDLNIDISDKKRIRKIIYLTYAILSRSQMLYQMIHA